LKRDKDVFQQFRQLHDEVHKVIIGEDEVIQAILIAMFTGNHVLLESVPGMGKTVLAKTITQTMDMDFKRVQCTPDLTAHDLVGKVKTDEETGEKHIEKGVVFTNILLCDEINRAKPVTQSAMLEVMEEQQVTLGGVDYKLPQPFTVLATQNPVEQEGTFPLPEAQKDRFVFKVVMKYPTLEEEMMIIKSKGKHETVNKIFNPPEVMIIREEIKNNVTISDNIMEYALKIIQATRTRREVDTGGSPRASVAFLETTKAKAFMEGRDYVTVDDVKELSFPILRHRIILNPDSREMGITTDDIISKVLERVEAPVD
jgi:MoxR-like ATPase